ncbi:GNAT family N-acetyltransferase [Clostridium perfringens]|uniref:GNAT family N-acetyltransferase n=1 Tax=Clostridium perfringens TaxID=1502 RepID=UPI0018E484BB|nr:GNAT family N-acetyltransferase [Clostridium perfringens]ELC8370429.1 peptidoglycan bridge formation glycyltransferase FemA/FemB family protein [Clostridium perfringens]ELC8374280.1 peptidoglycan bridge formation glycyltransferase FemA/FemB family protein [Clostridium perfringens]ELC8374586.1 peptidoglycan bridge formation glycyltransferase FemA/FemB family protein [Clostridium perfringens]MBI5983594.1 peptidoglycan bridge formation glycyltransferase FemA/FemB family protein [Clostridium per
MFDIYFKEEYGKICEYVDGGVYEVFQCKTENGYIKNMFIKRPVPWLINGIQYFDIITPYGYGGPIIYEVKDKDELIKDYKREFEKYCFENKIVCEFLRWHPIYDNKSDFEDVYENIYSRHTVGTNIKDYDDPVQSEFSKSARKEMKKSIKSGITCSVHPNPYDLSIFRKLYEETMDRNHAEEMYYFPDKYYELLTTTLRPYIIEIRAHYEDEIIASEIYFTAGNILHAHLLGSNQAFLDLGGGILLEATAANWGKENTYHYIHHGGGRTSAEDDSLYLYKKKFGKNTEFDFYIGRKVWNQEIYDLLVEKKKLEGEFENPEFFPLYRA